MKRRRLPAAFGPVWINLTVLFILAACGVSVQPQTFSKPGAATIIPTGVREEPVSPEQTPLNPTTVGNTQADQPSATPSAPADQAMETPLLETSTASQPGIPEDNVTSFPDPAGFTWRPIISGLEKPLDLASPPDGSGRLFILEQPGVIRIAQGSTLLPEPFLDIHERVQSRGNEQGLLGIAFHPDYAQNGFFYINYTGYTGIGDTVIARFQVSADNLNRADLSSEKILLTVKQPYQNHNGGGMAFGPDGYLYISLGDGGSANDPQGNAQSLDTLLGKLLRVDVNGGEPYTIPADNPFASGSAKQEIWAFGLRNPWRFSFDRLTGDLYIADVGQNMWEEVNFLPVGTAGGSNFGWNILEGTHPFAGEAPVGGDLVDPIFEYSHNSGCSITGGYVYRGQALPEFRGMYLLADFCSGKVWGLLRDANGAWQWKELFQTGLSVTSFGQDAEGELYLLDRGSGTAYQLQRK